MITIAIAKGRMQDDALALLARAGVCIAEDDRNSRRLAVTDDSGKYRFIFVKPADVPVYVEHGIADCGVVGRDVLLESQADLLLPLDLGIARCRMVVAAVDPGIMTRSLGMLRVATKYSQIAAAHFGARGIPVEIIQLSGSVELAPALGLADLIVDLVETGRTLRENGLTVVEEIAESTGKLVVNRASYQLKAGSITELVKALEAAVKETVSEAVSGSVNETVSGLADETVGGSANESVSDSVSGSVKESVRGSAKETVNASVKGGGEA